MLKEKIENKITIIDALMGTGKSTYMIEKIINAHPEKRYLVVVPTKDKTDKNKQVVKIGEIGRYMKAITADTFEPSTKPNKTKDLQRLIAKGVNIVTTHALIQLIDETTIAVLKKADYTLVIDECLNVVMQYKRKFSSSDVKTIIHDEWAKPDEDGYLIWNSEKEKDVFANKYNGRWDDIKRLCKMHCLMCHKTGKEKFSDNIIMWTFPIEFFKLFEQSYICTYLWNGSIQKSYFDMHKVRYEHMTLIGEGEEKRLIPYDPMQEKKLRQQYYNLINIYSGKLNAIGEPDKANRNPLTKSWYDSRKKGQPMYLEIVKRNTINYFKNVVKTHSPENMWSVLKDFKTNVSGDGYSRGFVSCNAKGTNEYRNKISLAYLLNLYPPVNLSNFFKAYGIGFNVDSYALSEMLQWIFRSRIRDGEKINLYLPSLRMRTLLQEWAEGKI